MSYVDRKRISDKSEKKVEEFLRHQPGVKFTTAGVEKFVSRQVTDALAVAAKEQPILRFLRHLPDFKCAFHGKPFWVDAKTGGTISREAYEVYMEMTQKEPVHVVFDNHGLWGVKVEKLVFAKPSTALPVDGHWVCPRKLPPDQYAKWKAEKPYASGTDFGVIDFAKTPWTFKPIAV